MFDLLINYYFLCVLVFLYTPNLLYMDLLDHKEEFRSVKELEKIKK